MNGAGEAWDGGDATYTGVMAWANAVRPIMEDPANRTADWFDACMRMSEFSIDLE